MIGTIEHEAESSLRAANAKRLAIFTSHPIQYQAPLFRALAASGSIAPTVYFGSRHGAEVAVDVGFGTAFKWDVPLLDGYEHEFLPNHARKPDVSRFRGVRLSRPEALLANGNYDAVLVCGWQTLAHIQMIRAAWNVGLPVLLRGDSTLQRLAAAGTRGLARRVMWLPARQRLYTAAFRRVAGFLVVGSRNLAYYRSFGVGDDKLFWAPAGVDNDWFALPERARLDARARVRSQLGLDGQAIVFASSAKLIARKRPLDLVHAVAKLRAQGVGAHALFIGDGEQHAEIEQRAAQLGIAGATTIAGFVNQRELPDWYAAADALVLPSDSRETWGLVVNEAMAAGLPVVVSDAAGCSVDLVQPGENGFTYRCGDVEALTGRLAAVATLGSEGRRAFGERSRELVKGFSLNVTVDATVQALDAVCDRRPATRSR